MSTPWYSTHSLPTCVTVVDKITIQIFHLLPSPASCLVAQSCLTLCNLWALAHQAPLSMEFSRQEYWSGLSFPSPGDRPHPWINPTSPALQADSLPSKPAGKPIFSKCKSNCITSVTNHRVKIGKGCGYKEMDGCKEIIWNSFSTVHESS